jgi:hypothetical protein
VKKKLVIKFSLIFLGIVAVILLVFGGNNIPMLKKVPADSAAWFICGDKKTSKAAVKASVKKSLLKILNNIDMQKEDLVPAMCCVVNTGKGLSQVIYLRRKVEFMEAFSLESVFGSGLLFSKDKVGSFDILKLSFPESTDNNAWSVMVGGNILVLADSKEGLKKVISVCSGKAESFYAVHRKAGYGVPEGNSVSGFFDTAKSGISAFLPLFCRDPYRKPGKYFVNYGFSKDKTVLVVTDYNEFSPDLKASQLLFYIVLFPVIFILVVVGIFFMAAGMLAFYYYATAWLTGCLYSKQIPVMETLSPASKDVFGLGNINSSAEVRKDD